MAASNGRRKNQALEIGDIVVVQWKDHVFHSSSEVSTPEFHIWETIGWLAAETKEGYLIKTSTIIEGTPVHDAYAIMKPAVLSIEKIV